MVCTSEIMGNQEYSHFFSTEPAMQLKDTGFAWKMAAATHQVVPHSLITVENHNGLLQKTTGVICSVKKQSISLSDEAFNLRSN